MAYDKDKNQILKEIVLHICLLYSNVTNIFWTIETTFWW